MGTSATATRSFISKLKDYPPLEREDELRLAHQYCATGDPAIAKRLVEGHIRLVVKIARECCFRSSMLPDLIQEGSMGLMRAVTKYDPNKGVRLSTYAAWWIRAYILQYVMTNFRISRVATTFAQRKLFFALKRERERMISSDGSAAASAIAQRLGVSEKDVLDMEQRLGARDVEFDSLACGDTDADASESPDALFERNEIKEAVRAKLAVLSGNLEAREKLVFEKRLFADEPITLQEIGKRCGISRERARQIEERLKQRLRPHFAPIAGYEEESAAA